MEPIQWCTNAEGSISLISKESIHFLYGAMLEGMIYAENDIGCTLCRYDVTDEQIARYLRFYVGRELREDEKRFY